MKPFQTHIQQIRILRGRGLTIRNGSYAMRILENEGYYNVINGYKDLFLVLNQNGAPASPEQYKPGTTFEEIHKLYVLDRELRNILLKYLLIFEKSVKSKISYRFSQKFKKANDYLNLKNFTSNTNQLKQVLKLITTLSNVITNQSDRNGPIKHYLDVHQEVPLWVLSNYLTLGNIQNFYMCLDDPLKDLIAQDFSKMYKKTYNVNLQFPKDSLIDVLKTANLFRNVCAHEERLYNFSLHRPARSRHNSNLLSIPNNLLTGNLFTMVSFLKLVITKKEHKSLISSLSQLFNKSQNDFSSVNFSQILNRMGFPSNWQNFF
ncbi:Abi family protein [Bacillus sp. BRMEA1]|uniref:Abi family protein n=1 Tax=Neobacillus endophyticus TaxID=2738405 RepID=UPI001563C5C0|nr:Abi family protein [Neobacillus endophyticus]NRD81134.1 Abi family protein [Neobacillus endophyticus]